MTPPFEEATARFLDWLSKHNFTISPKLEIQDLRHCNQGRGMIATEDISDDEELFSIPREAVINIGNCALTDGNSEIKDKLLKLNHWESLIIILLYELNMCGKESKWNDYFNTLPIRDDENYQFNQLMFWTSNELDYLSPSLILDRIGKDEAENMFHKLFPNVVSEYLGIPELSSVTIDQYHKVASLIMSYSFDVERPDYVVDLEEEEGEDGNEESENKENDESVFIDGYFKSMVPLADILNADTKLHNASLMYTPQALVMKSIKPIRKGEQIYNTYSDHPNGEILRRYGYVETEGSKYDFGEIPLIVIQNYFINILGLPSTLLDEVFVELDKLAEQDEEENFVKVVLDSYDCFKDSEVILELIFIIQILSIVAILYENDSLNFTNNENKSLLIVRISRKCYQLIESKKLTNSFLKNYEQIIRNRIAEYPKNMPDNFSEGTTTRREMAKVVLRSEYNSLVSCLDINKVFLEQESYKFIDDGKLMRNIIKKRTNDNANIKSVQKRSKML